MSLLASDKGIVGLVPVKEELRTGALPPLKVTLSISFLHDKREVAKIKATTNLIIFISVEFVC